MEDEDTAGWFGVKDDEDVVAGDVRKPLWPDDELKIIEWVFQEKLWHDGYSKLDLAQFWLEKLGRGLASFFLGGLPTLEESGIKQKASGGVSWRFLQGEE